MNTSAAAITLSQGALRFMIRPVLLVLAGILILRSEPHARLTFDATARWEMGADGVRVLASGETFSAQMSVEVQAT